MGSSPLQRARQRRQRIDNRPTNPAIIGVFPRGIVPNPLLSLPFEAAIEGLGPECWDVVEAATFPRTVLRFRNDALLHQLGLDPGSIQDVHLEEAYGRFAGRHPLLALRYHGHQFGIYNPLLGDGRGFLYGQLRDRHGQLQDLGSKGSGTTPWSRGGDGRLTLKGGVRELIAGEALHRLGVSTSRTLSLIETGEDLWRSDEPSPTRSSVMVRMARTHLRFGSCERLLHRRQPAQLARLLEHVVQHHYPRVAAAHPGKDGAARQARLLAFHGELVERVARLAAGWMVAGFTHGVLNTDNMSLAGESFDYGPFAFLDRWDPGFTAACFDHTGLYAYGRQPAVCHENLRLLQAPLTMLLPRQALEEQLDRFAPAYASHYRTGLLRRLGLMAPLEAPEPEPQTPTRTGAGLPDPVPLTLQLLASWDVAYGDLFDGLARLVSRQGIPETAEELLPCVAAAPAPPRGAWIAWREAWWAWSRELTKQPGGRAAIQQGLQRWNLCDTPIRPRIEMLWQAIEQRDDWQPLQRWLASVQRPEESAAAARIAA